MTVPDKGVDRIKDTLSANAKRGRITESQAADRLAKLTPSLKMEDLGKADLIIEAVFENMALKKEVFQKLDKIAKSRAIIASNTSTLDVDDRELLLEAKPSLPVTQDLVP